MLHTKTSFSPPPPQKMDLLNCVANSLDKNPIGFNAFQAFKALREQLQLGAVQARCTWKIRYVQFLFCMHSILFPEHDEVESYIPFCLKCETV